MVNYLVHSEDDRKKILKTIGKKNIEDLFSSVPESIFMPKFELPEGLAEQELKYRLKEISGLNNPLTGYSSFLGGGAYDHYIPSAVKDITSISQFYTAYTPYQAEISQGTLQYIFEFQSMICRLTGMDIANASMYDGATSLAEAFLLAARVTGKNKAVFSRTIDPQYRETLKTYLYGYGIGIEEIDFREGITDLNKLENAIDSNTCAVALQNPNFFGCFEEVFKVRDLVAELPDCMYIICANPLSLALLKPPSEYGADIVVGDAQSLGNSLNFGGPYLGYFAARKKYLRQVPGRIVGKTVDSDNNDAFVLTYQAREQHIRKTKATSNICSNHSLNALAAAAFLAVLGEEGLRELANTCMQGANYFSEKLSDTSSFSRKFNTGHFNEVVISTDLVAGELLKKLRKEKILGGIPLGKHYPELADSILVSFTEKNMAGDINRYLNILKNL